MSFDCKQFGANNGGTDEWYTPTEAVEILLKYIKPGATILCPFDTAESNFVKVFRGNGFIVKHSHINEGTDLCEVFKGKKEMIEWNFAEQMTLF